VPNNALTGEAVRIHISTVWTTDAPYREMASAVRFYQEQGVAAVAMEAAALYAFAEARSTPVLCLAHVTNQMAVVEGDFEKGQDNDTHDALEVIRLTAQAWVASKHQNGLGNVVEGVVPDHKFCIT
jgi:uridine phosphorylase